MGDERGSFPLALLILVVGFVAVIWLAADACFDDEDEADDLGAPALIAGHYDGGGAGSSRDRDRGRNSRGDCEGAGYCDERDGIHADQIIICLPDSHCQFGESPALLPQT